MIKEENASELPEIKEKALPWLVCFAATLFFFYEFIQGNMFASIAANIMQDFQIQAEKMAWLSSIYYASNVIFLFIAGMILDRFSIKNTLLLAMLLCISTTFVLAGTESFGTALVCRFIMGIGSAFCFLGPVRLASNWFPPGRMALVTGFIVTMAMTGGMLAQYPLTALITHIGWRSAVQYVGYLGIVMFLLMMWWIKEKPDASRPKPPKEPILKHAKAAYLNPVNICAALYTSLMNMPIAVFGAMMGTLYLQQRLGVGPEEASLVNTVLFFGAIIGGPVIGGISDKIGLRLLPMKIGVLISLILVLIILFVPVTYYFMMVLFFLLGFFTSAQIISYALVAENSPLAITAMAVSVISILTQGGYILYQNLFSILLERFGDMKMMGNVPVYSLNAYQHAAIIFPIGLFIAWLLLSKLKETHGNRIRNH